MQGIYNACCRGTMENEPFDEEEPEDAWICDPEDWVCADDDVKEFLNEFAGGKKE